MRVDRFAACCGGLKACAACGRATSFAALPAGTIASFTAAFTVGTWRAGFTRSGLHGRQVGCGQFLLADLFSACGVALTTIAALTPIRAIASTTTLTTLTTFTAFTRWPGLALFPRGRCIAPRRFGRSLGSGALLAPLSTTRLAAVRTLTRLRRGACP